VLCAAPDREGLAGLRRASVGAQWELVGGAASLDVLESQVLEWRPDVVVLDAGLGRRAVEAARRARPGVRVVSLGPLEGADAEVAELDEVRPAILGLPRPGGPVRG
jgi:hypothetical protein